MKVTFDFYAFLLSSILSNSLCHLSTLCQLSTKVLIKDVVDRIHDAILKPTDLSQSVETQPSEYERKADGSRFNKFSSTNLPATLHFE